MKIKYIFLILLIVITFIYCSCSKSEEKMCIPNCPIDTSCGKDDGCGGICSTDDTCFTGRCLLDEETNTRKCVGLMNSCSDFDCNSPEQCVLAWSESSNTGGPSAPSSFRDDVGGNCLKECCLKNRLLIPCESRCGGKKCGEDDGCGGACFGDCPELLDDDGNALENSCVLSGAYINPSYQKYLGDKLPFVGYYEGRYEKKKAELTSRIEYVALHDIHKCCVPDCPMGSCGKDDGCGGICWKDEYCEDENGKCITVDEDGNRECCVPDCPPGSCGKDDGCGGICWKDDSCEDESGKCITVDEDGNRECCVPDCPPLSCGKDDGCGGLCWKDDTCITSLDQKCVVVDEVTGNRECR